jgi:hypothetical protein
MYRAAGRKASEGLRVIQTGFLPNITQTLRLFKKRLLKEKPSFAKSFRYRKLNFGTKKKCDQQQAVACAVKIPKKEKKSALRTKLITNERK